MKAPDFNNFCEAWVSAQASMAAGKMLSQHDLSGIFDDLEDYTLEVVLASIKIHRKSARFAPVVFDIVEIIKDRTGAKHIGAEEAWTLAVRSFDESATVVWTKEIAEARALVCELYALDKVGARMAFKDAYARIIKTADNPKWFATIGCDPAQHFDAIAAAVRAKRLPIGAEAKYHLEAPITVQALIEQAYYVASKTYALAQCDLMKKILHVYVEPELIDERAHERAEFERKRSAQLDAVAIKLRSLVH